MNNKKGYGSIAVSALIVVLVLIIAGIAVLMTAGKGQVADRTTPVVAETSVAESSVAELNVAESKADSSLAELLETVKFPEKAADYKDIADKELSADYAILVNLEDNTITAGRKYDEKMYPASLTKVMALIVAAENITNFNDEYTFTNEDIDSLVEENASRADFEAGETVNMNDLMYASILVSGGDGVKGLANAVAGSEKAFVDMMNKKAEEMGLKNTNFVNASGLHDENHYSTCEDMAVIMKYALDNEQCRKVLTAEEYTTSKTKQHEDGIKLTSLLTIRLDGYFVEGGGDIIGGKTGFTDEAKFTLATVLKYKNSEYVCITAKSEKQLDAIEDNIKIYEDYLTSQTNDSSEAA